MTLSQRAVEAAARAISDTDGSGWDTILGKRECERNRYRSLAEAAITAALAVDGLCLVPKEPTDAMREAGAKFSAVCCAETGCIVGEVYRAMLSAANDGEERR